MIVRTIFSATILFCCSAIYAQISEDFSDGNFTDSPVWFGDTDDFEIDTDGKLHLNVPSLTSESYLSTPNSLINETTWEFYVELGFNTTSGNQLFVYLVSDQADLKGSLNGYLVRLGNTDDEVSLYRQSGTTLFEIIDGVDDILDVSASQIWVKVTRDSEGNWELWRSIGEEKNYVLEGSAQDQTFTTTAYFGFRCDYTSSNSQKFWMDDISISTLANAEEGFRLLSLTQPDDQSIKLSFNQKLDVATAQNAETYSIDDVKPE